ncbi:MAG: response regulator [Deltaproteobacteria bacterium]|jgi:signal transduction histidine kinase/CheY-like chemotaxis protein|nr:response regulator [Deltaproteobacteria bacterium]
MGPKDKELQDALTRLEKCCPGSTSDSNQQTLSSALHEALLNLDRARKQEQCLKEESDALLQGMDIIISSESTTKAFNMVLEVLKNLLGFDDAFVLREQGDGCLSVVASSSSQFENSVWQPGAMFKHVLAGNSVNIGDISNSTDWQAQPTEIRQNVSSALHTPFKTTTERAMLLCTSSQEGFFNKSHIKLLERFSPLAGQALYNIEINDLLRDEINERKQAEESLEAALTELQKAENAIREAYDDLEIRVEKRTAELRDSNILLQREISERKREEEEKEKMFAQLLQSQKMESIGLLAGGVAHDFNNILTTILGYSELSIMKMSEDDPLRTQMEDIHAAGVQASALTRQLLAFSRKQIMEIRVINLNYLITNMTKMLGRLIGENIELKLDLDKKLPNIKADPGQIEQILMNMAVNSKDAMPNGGDLSIRTMAVFINKEETTVHSGIKPGTYVMLAVQDTGDGMTKEVQNNIFEPFFTTKLRGKGTGLGLATVYGIVKQHNSYIFVDSEPGQGTLFSIYFPVTEKEVPERKPARPKLKTSRQATETMLVVDDDASIRDFITNTLSPIGYTCLKAANGIEALQLVQESRNTIDLLLTDVVMPGMNGPDLAKLFKKQFPESKVIFMSGYMSNVDFSDIIVLEEAFLQKPLTPTKLLDKLDEVLGVQPENRQEG